MSSAARGNDALAGVTAAKVGPIASPVTKVATAPAATPPAVKQAAAPTTAAAAPAIAVPAGPTPTAGAFARAQRPGPPPLPPSAPALPPSAPALPPDPPDRTDRVPVAVASPSQAEPDADLRSFARAVAEQAIAPFEDVLQQLGHRVDEVKRSLDVLERRPAPAVAPEVAPRIESTLQQLERRMDEVQRRLELLERRPAPAAAPAAAAAAAPAPARATAAAPAPNRTTSVAPQFQLPVQPRGGEISVQIGPELRALDGRRRRVRFVTGVVLFLVVAFGGLFVALAQSYMPTHP